MESQLIDRLRGMLYGLAIGDALGAAVEFKPPGTFEPVTGYRGGGPHGLNPGEWTDDTSLALALADSLSRGWNETDQMQQYLAWYRTGKFSVNGRCFDIGNTTRAALERFSRGVPAEKCGATDPRSSGNGGIMRLAPVVIYAVRRGQVEAAADLARDASFVTHASPDCLAAAESLARRLVALVSGTSRGDSAQGSGPIRGSGYVVDSLEAALWAFRDAPDFRTAVLRAVNLGDDADTTGAVCGQLAGAYWGQSGIPADLIDGLARRDMIEAALAGLGIG